MRAVVESRHGGPEVLEVTEIPDPACGPQQVLIRVHAAGINRADVLQRQGNYPIPPGATYIYGLEAAGTVLEIGREAEGHLGLKVGDPVMALLDSGGYAEKVAVHHAQVMPMPEDLDFVQAAALPEVAATVWSNLFVTEGLSPDGPNDDEEFVLIHGGTGGIGMHAIQLVRSLGYRVLTTVGSRDKAERVRQLVAQQDETIRLTGAHQAGDVRVIDYTREDFAAVVREATRGVGAAAILDVVGGKYLQANVDSLSWRGHLVIIGLQGGARGELDLSALMSKRASITATTLRVLSPEAKGEILSDLSETELPLLESGVIDPMVDRVFPLEQVREAHEYFDSGEHRGKVVLRLA